MNRSMIAISFDALAALLVVPPARCGLCECARWWHWAGIKGVGRWVPGHGVGCGEVRCHEVTKRLLASAGHAVDWLPWERLPTRCSPWARRRST